MKFREGAGIDEYIALWQKKYYEFNEDMYEQYIAATGAKISKEEKEKLCRMEIKLVPMDEFYFNTQFENYSNGSIGTTITQLAIALVIVIVAFINFVNFFIALVPVRMRTVNICKVFGASSNTLRWNFVFEAVGLVLITLSISSLFKFFYFFRHFKSVLSFCLYAKTLSCNLIHKYACSNACIE